VKRIPCPTTYAARGHTETNREGIWGLDGGKDADRRKGGNASPEKTHRKKCVMGDARWAAHDCLNAMSQGTPEERGGAHKKNLGPMPTPRDWTAYGRGTREENKWGTAKKKKPSSNDQRGEGEGKKKLFGSRREKSGNR